MSHIRKRGKSVQEQTRRYCLPLHRAGHEAMHGALHQCCRAGPPLQSRLKTAGALTLLAAVSVTAAHVPLEQA